ncbi:hypothetical protein VSS86_19560, partial [Bacillus safensis]|uniref:DNA ligase LigA-related protein n=1 Tax=Bacillus safensis TaxID=561879 RepID=UPI002DD422A4
PASRWGTPVEIERRRRIRVALWAYAYEIADNPMVDDATFDEEAKKIDVQVSTGNTKLDLWFRKNFSAFTGSWVRQHPELHKLAALYQKRSI